MSYGEKIFGLRDIKLTSFDGATQVDLPSSQQLEFNEALTTGELRGDDVTKSVVSFTDKVEWSFSSGGFPLDAYGLITGRTVTEANTTPNRTNTMTGKAGDVMPWFKIYGKSQGDASDDIHVKIFKCKLMEAPSGSFSDTEFFITSCSGIAVHDDTADKLFEVVQNETSTALPSS